MKKQIPQTRFGVGDKVLLTSFGKSRIATICKEPYWNGFNWMYSFEGEAVTLGEMYLTRYEEPTPDNTEMIGWQMARSILADVAQKGGGE